MGVLDAIRPELAILLEAIAAEFHTHQDQLESSLEAKAIAALMSAYKKGADSVYNRTTITPAPMPAVRPRSHTLKPRKPTQSFDENDENERPTREIRIPPKDD